MTAVWAAATIVGIPAGIWRLISARFAEKKGRVQVTLNPDRILDQILETFVEYDDWLTFRQLAYRLTGGPSNEQLIAGIVHGHGRVFVVRDGCRCKLRTELIEAAAGIAPRLQELSKHL